jgi:mannose/fructose/N-acetylgalactosamine-specific phosphotransferase system component IID
MKEKWSKLIDVKSIVTIILTAVFAYLAVKGEITGAEFLIVISTVYGFYFGTQKTKKEGE